MKKSSTKTLQTRKLMIRREAVASLTPPQLLKVVGGSDGLDCSLFSSCNQVSTVAE